MVPVSSLTVRENATLQDIANLSWVASVSPATKASATLIPPSFSECEPCRAPDNHIGCALGLVLVHASWNQLATDRIAKTVRQWTVAVFRQQGWLQLDDKDQELGHNNTIDNDDTGMMVPFGAAICIDQDNTDDFVSQMHWPLPPDTLPALAIVWQHKCSTTDAAIHTDRAAAQQFHATNHSHLCYVAKVRAADLLRAVSDNSGSLFVRKILRPVQSVMASAEEAQFASYTHSIHWQRQRRKNSSAALRIFVAGDKSSVGKSSVCLGILGTLLAEGYATPETLAYIKPATQSESTQLIQLYCEQHGIQCVPVGPLVYYRGFTRAFLAGETRSTTELLQQCADAVDAIAHGKQVVLIDGVGFPSVGSICGTSNAAVAQACGYPLTTATGSAADNNYRSPLGVVLVGGSGVGAAVDAFNLNVAYFEHQAAIPVMGGIFNKLSAEGYYSLASCKAQVTAYFQTNQEQIDKGRQAFGFLPLFPRLIGKHALEHVDEYIRIFRDHVRVSDILRAAERIKTSGAVAKQSKTLHSAPSVVLHDVQALTADSMARKRSRQEIEALAIAAGAAPSA
jgi:AAA domain